MAGERGRHVNIKGRIRERGGNGGWETRELAMGCWMEGLCGWRGRGRTERAEGEVLPSQREGAGGKEREMMMPGSRVGFKKRC